MTATHAGNPFIAGSARTQLSVISCHGCTAPKGCCHHRVTAWLHEGVPIAQRLRHEQRDTPALRDALRDAAVLMARRDSAYSRPCVFLDAAERCTIYDDRPSVCVLTCLEAWDRRDYVEHIASRHPAVGG